MRRSGYSAAAVFTAVIAAVMCGCSGQKEQVTTTSTTTAVQTATVSTEQTAETTTATTTTTEAETEAPLPEVTYPCEVTKEEFHCTNGDNDIFGTLYIPENQRDKHPTVILSHGFNCIGEDMSDVARQLAKNGVMAYTFDYCGGSTRSASSGSTEEMSISSEQEDLRRVIDTISELESCDETKLYLYGESQGGFVAALTGAEMPDMISAMFLVYPAFSIMDNWSSMDPETMTEPVNFNGVMLSRAFVDGLPDYDVYEHIAKYTNYVHIYQGDSDYVVNLSYAKRINEAFPNSELTVYEGVGHGFGGKAKKDVKDTMCAYFADNGIVE